MDWQANPAHHQRPRTPFHHCNPKTCVAGCVLFLYILRQSFSFLAVSSEWLIFFYMQDQSWVPYQISNGALQPPTAWSGELAQRTLAKFRKVDTHEKGQRYCIVLYTHIVYLLYI